MIRPIKKEDVDKISRLAVKVYSESNIGELKEEFLLKLNNDYVIVLCLEIDHQVIGFAECSLRYDYVEGTSTSPVGYLEGIYIDDNYRKNGFAKLLVDECCKWAKDKGCSEFASDCPLDNSLSIEVHKHLGFEEVSRIVCFKKELS